MKKCKDCTICELMKEKECCKDSDEQFRLKILISETIMEKCFDCDYWHNPLPFWHEDIYKIKGGINDERLWFFSSTWLYDF